MKSCYRWSGSAVHKTGASIKPLERLASVRSTGVAPVSWSSPPQARRLCYEPTPPALAVLGAKHGHVALFQQLAVAQVHVDPARQAGVEAAHGAHDVDPLELVRPVVLEDGRVL